MGSANTPESAPMEPSGRAEAIGFGNILGGTWEIYKKHYKPLTLIYLVTAIVTIAIYELVIPAVQKSFVGSIDDAAREQFLSLQGPMMTALVIIMVLGAIASAVHFITYGAGLRACGEIETGGVSVGRAFAFSWGRFRQGLVLAVRIFIYTLAWVGLLIIIAFVGWVWVMAMSAERAGTPARIENLSQYTTAFGILGLIGVAALVIIAIVALIRGLKASFSYAIFFNDEKVTPREALDRSISMAEGITGTIFWNYILLGVLFAIVGGIYGGIVAQLAFNFIPPQSAFVDPTLAAGNTTTSFNQMIALLTLPLTLVAGAVGFIFQYVFMKNASLRGVPGTPGTLGGTPGTLGGTPGTEPGARAPNRAPTTL